MYFSQLSCRWFRNSAESYVKVPFFGAVSHLTLFVSPFCITFAALWGVYHNLSFAWIGQDILVGYGYHLILFLLSYRVFFQHFMWLGFSLNRELL